METKTKIFTTQPTINPKDRKRIAATGILDSWNKCVQGLNKHNPDADDLKRMVLIELERIGGPRRDILEKLIVRVQKAEREDILHKVNLVSQSLKLA